VQSKDSKSQKNHCMDELVNTEEKFVSALQMIQEVGVYTTDVCVSLFC